MAGVIVGSLSSWEAHLLLALSAQVNLLISVSDEDTLPSLSACLRRFCQDSSIGRSCHVVRLERQDAATLSAESLLAGFFKDAQGVGELAQVIVIPYIDELPRSTQATLKDVLRDRRFVLHENSYLLPRDFICVGMVIDEGLEGSGLSRHLVDYFGLSLSLSSVDDAGRTVAVPPIIPSKPVFYYAPRLRTYTSDLLSGLRHHPSLHAYLLTNRCSTSYVLSIADLWAKLKHAGYDDKSGVITYPPSGDIRPVDVQEVILSCLGHSLRLREEKERLSSFWGAPGHKEDQGKSVPDIVQDLLYMI